MKNQRPELTDRNIVRLSPEGWRMLKNWLKQLPADTRGTAVVEAAIALPMMLMLIMGGISYGNWFMSAHSVQQAANEAARAAVGSINDLDREAIVNDVIDGGVLSTGAVNPEHVEVETELDGDLFTVRISYDISDSLLLSSSVIPLPEGPIVRSARVRLTSV